MSSALALETVAHALAGMAKLSGTVMRLRQFEALHQSEPDTASASPPWGLTSWPGAKLPVDWHAAVTLASWNDLGRSAGASRLPDESQLTPMTGTATSEQGTVVEQPREAFSAAVHTSKFTEPVPSSPVVA